MTFASILLFGKSIDFGHPTQRSQWMLVAGFLLLGWVMARRTIRRRKTTRKQSRDADRELRRIREAKSPSVPLADAPVAVQRWQVAMMETQRELSAELDTRIAVAKTLLSQTGAAETHEGPIPPRAITPPAGDNLLAAIARLQREGQSADQIAEALNVPAGEIRWSIATLSPNGKVAQLGTGPGGGPIAVNSRSLEPAQHA